MASKPRAPRVVARGRIFRIPVTVQGEFVNSLTKRFDAMAADVQRQLTDLFDKEYAREHFGNDGVGMDAANIGSQTRILVNKMKEKYDQLFGSISSDTAKAMLDGLNRSSASQSKTAIKDLPNFKDEAKKYTIKLDTLDKATKTILNAATAKAADFIKSIPERYLNTVASAVYNSITTGNGMQDLIPFFEQHDAGTRRWVHLTAMDQTRKAYNGLNLGRMRSIGIKKGEWIHSAGSQKPRPLHVDFDGKTFDLDVGAPVGDDDGNNVMPGEEENCRCTFGPVLTADEPAEAGQEEDE